jgi:hypothetical protein
LLAGILLLKEGVLKMRSALAETIALVTQRGFPKGEGRKWRYVVYKDSHKRDPVDWEHFDVREETTASGEKIVIGEISYEKLCYLMRQTIKNMTQTINNYIQENVDLDPF